MTLDESVHGMRLRVIERAQVQGNVSAVCRELGISRTVFYRWRNRLERYGVDGVHPRRQRAQAGRPVATAPEVERLVLAIAISAATWGCRRIAAYLARTWRGGRLGPRPKARVFSRPACQQPVTTDRNRKDPRSRRSPSVENHFRYWVGPNILLVPG